MTTPSALHHALIYEAPNTVDELISLGAQLWLYNTRGHGDEDDSFIWVEGRLVMFKKSKRAKTSTLTFLFNSPMGVVQKELGEDEATWRLAKYVTFMA